MSVSRSTPTNILFLFSSFVGRANDMDQLWELLTTPHLSIITVVGAGGVGKTRLALELAKLIYKRSCMPQPAYGKAPCRRRCLSYKPP